MRDGDLIRVDIAARSLDLLVDPAELTPAVTAGLLCPLCTPAESSRSTPGRSTRPQRAPSPTSPSSRLQEPTGGDPGGHLVHHQSQGNRHRCLRKQPPCPRPRAPTTGRARDPDRLGRDPALPREARRHRRLRPAGRRHHPVLRRADGLDHDPPHPRPPRAGRRPRRRGLRRRHRQGRGRHRDVRPRRDEPRHRDRRRLHGQRAAARDHRPGVLDADGHRRLPGGRHRRHHDADHEALLPRHEARKTSRRRSPPPTRSPRPVARAPSSSTSRKTPSRTPRRSSGPRRSTCPATGPITKAHGKQITAAAQLLAEAERPVFYVGGGVIRAECVRKSSAPWSRRRAPPSSRR